MHETPLSPDPNEPINARESSDSPPPHRAASPTSDPSPPDGILVSTPASHPRSTVNRAAGPVRPPGAASEPEMLEPRIVVNKSVPMGWLLLVVPVALIAGWAIGHRPAPKTTQPSAATTNRAPSPVAENAPPSSSRHRSDSFSTGGGGDSRSFESTGGGGSGSSRSESETPSESSFDSERHAQSSEWTTLDNAMAEAQRTGKPVLLDFNAEWCGPCQRMKEQVFDDEARGRAVKEAVVPVSITDRAREDGHNPSEIDDLQRKFQVDAFPTLVVIAPGNGRAMRIQGFGDADQTLTWITMAAKAVR